MIRGMTVPGESDVAQLMGVRQAIDVIDAEPVTPRVERRRLHEAQGLRLAEDVAADRDYPPFDKSLMDGYAVRSADVKELPTVLRVVDVVPAGQWPRRAVAAGEAVAIMTGAPMPEGADAVVPVEDVEETPEGVRVLRAEPTPGRHVARRGSDVPAGQRLLTRGTLLESPQLAVAASVGLANPQVYARPTVAVLGTGDEIVPVERTPGPAQIRDSNTLMLAALLARLGCAVRNLGTVQDDVTAMRAAFEEGLNADVLFVTGGMSMGTRDFVPGLLRDMGFQTRIAKLRIKPGKPFVFAVRAGDDAGVAPAGTPQAGERTTPDFGGLGQFASPQRTRYVFGLPGNPVSAFVCTLRLASRLLTRLAGGVPRERWLSGRIEVGMPPNGPREFYQPVVRQVAAGISSNQNELAAIRLLPWKGSADLFTLAQANALLVRPENEPPVAKGTLVRVLEI
jgi:molybdopterin molybdotransferase